MRINKISLRNINSLRGDHEVDFDKSPLLDAGIFAIVGPTGSGKSTLLDAITLALYNRVPRFGHITKAEIEKSGSVITHFQKEALAEVTYTVNEKIYRSSWSIMKNRNDNLNPVYMELVDVTNGEVIVSDKISEVPAVNEKFIGLNYDQFVKSIVLSQGEFAQFLKAEADKRSELLEKITGTEIYRQLGKSAFERFREVEGEGKTLEIRLKQIQIIPEEVEAQLNESIVSGEQEISDLRQYFNKVSEGAEKLRNYESANQRLLALEQIADSNLKNQKAFEPELHRIQKHLKLAPYVKELARHGQLEKDILGTNDYIIDANKKIDLLKNEIKQSEITLSRVLQKEVTSANFRPFMQHFESTYNELKQLERSLGDEGKLLKNNWLAKLSASNDSKLKSFSELKDYPTISSEVQKYKADILKLFGSQVPSETGDLLNAVNEINQEILTLNGTLSNLGFQIENVTKITQITSEILELQDQKTLAAEKLINSQSALEVAFINYEKASKIKDDATKSANLAQYKELLKNGEACPLCGQIVTDIGLHQLADLGLLTLAESKAKDEWQKQEKIYKEVDGQVMLVTSQVKAKTDHLHDLISKTGNHSLEELLAKRNNYTSTLAQKQLQQKNLQTQIEAVQKLRVIDDCLVILGDLNLKADQYSKNKNKLTALLSGFEANEAADVLGFTNKLQELLSNDSTKVKQIEAQIETYELNLKKLETEHVQLKVYLIEELKKGGFESIQEAESNMLNASTFEQLSSQKQRLDEEKVRNDTALATTRQDVLQLKEGGLPVEDMATLAAKKLQLEQQIEAISKSIGGAQQALKSNKEQIELKHQLMSEFQTFEQKIKRWRLLKELIGDASGKTFSGFAQHLTLEHLILLSNQRLKSLTDRYLIAAPEPQGDIEVIDQYQANIKRSAKTLSGGETFLISLSFALGLSDLAARDFTLESLFIDEGFGTLDNETLESALNTLELLQSESNKTIGIISHVDSLKERIHTQIKLMKDASGNSILQIIG
ncbi:MAG TPA: AAA family ATPase [Saprospiraceae bacterium]|nr:AAA family ATPase [Saprospiraceae bacterium]HPN68424.1 AAA family ATPase [Saprospiraceae bacterium]